jgi:hypothetical protein
MSKTAPFLGFNPGDLVLVQPDPEDPGASQPDWWMGWIVFCEGNARDPAAPSLFQVADCDDGRIRWVNADEATRLVLSGLQTSKVVPLLR